jgi:ParB/RepB/Spo0J family partition protein
VGKHIALDKIRRSELNRTLTDEDVRDLAASMQSVGQLVPIILRPLAGSDLYEIVAGERRWRAACLLEWRSIDAIVREDLDDKDAQELRLVENLQRRDVPPLEQSQGVAVLLEMHDGNAAEVAARLGVPESWVYVRARLRNLSPNWRALLADDAGDLYERFRSSVTWQEELAKLPQDTQDELLKNRALLYVQSRADLRGLIADHLMTIGDAPWPKRWEAGRPKDRRCALCEKRSDREAVLFPELLSEENARCLDSACWAGKLAEWLKGIARPIVQARGEIAFLYEYDRSGMDDMVHEIRALAGIRDHEAKLLSRAQYDEDDGVPAAGQKRIMGLHISGKKIGQHEMVLVCDPDTDIDGPDDDNDNDNDANKTEAPTIDPAVRQEVDALCDAIRLHVRGLSSIPGDPARLMMAICSEVFGGVAEITMQDRYRHASAMPMRDLKESLWPFLQRVLVNDLEYAQDNLELDGLKAMEAFLAGNGAKAAE